MVEIIVMRMPTVKIQLEASNVIAKKISLVMV